MRRAVIVVAIALASGAACSLFVSTDGLQNGESDASIATDSGSGDVATNDASIDAEFDAGFDAGVGPFCLTHPGHLLCADFDEDAAVDLGWSTDDLGGGGAIDVAFDASTSPPASFVATLPAIASSSDGNARFGKEFTTAIPTKVHVEFDLNLCDVSGLAGGYYEIFKLAFGPGFDDNGLELQISDTTPYVKTDLPGSTYNLTQKIVPFTWTHVTIDVAVATSGSITITLNGTTALDVSGIDTTQENVEAGYHAAVVGLYGTGSPACASFFDNVLIDAE